MRERQHHLSPVQPSALLAQGRLLALCLLLGLAAWLAPARLALAQDATLTLQMQYTTGGKTTGIGGVTATAYQVASLDDAINHYTLLDSFAALKVNFDEGLTASEATEIAGKAVGLATAAKLQGASVTSDATGTAAFGSLPYGVYLVMQTGATGDAEGYYNFTPFLVSVPQVAEGVATYDVTIVSKTTLKPKTPEEPDDPSKKPTKPSTTDTTGVSDRGKNTKQTKTTTTTATPASPLAKTGDLLRMELVVRLAVAGAVLVCVGLVLRRRSRRA